MNNPLAATTQPSQGSDTAMHRHAAIWAHMHQQDPDTLRSHVEKLDYGLPIMRALVADPNVKAKDVIKAVSSAVADQKMEPSAGVALISSMPADPDKLKGWLRARQADSMATAVHAHAALIAHQQGTMAAIQQRMQQPPAPSPLAAMPTQPGAQ